MLFIIWTILVKLVDVAPIGPEGSEVGFAAMNGWFHRLTGVDMALYEMTDILSLVAFAVVGAFGILGLVQWIRRKKILKVDPEILALGIFYILVLAFFAAFEFIKINYRPVLIDGVLETSYPSSTTMLAITVFVSAMMVAPKYLSGWKLKVVTVIFGVMAGFLVGGRVLSGVHWLSDIIGGVLLSVELLLVFGFLKKKLQKALDKTL